MDLLAIEEKRLGVEYSGWIEEAMKTETCRQAEWSESVAVGGKNYVEKIKEELGCRAVGRKVQERLQAGMSILREPDSSYIADLGIKKSLIGFIMSLMFFVGTTSYIKHYRVVVYQVRSD